MCVCVRVCVCGCVGVWVCGCVGVCGWVGGWVGGWVCVFACVFFYRALIVIFEGFWVYRVECALADPGYGRSEIQASLMLPLLKAP